MKEVGGKRRLLASRIPIKIKHFPSYPAATFNVTMNKTTSSIIGQKRDRDQADLSPIRQSKAARFNVHTLKRLQNAANKDPEIDLTAQMPTDYSNRLAKMRQTIYGHLGRLNYATIYDLTLILCTRTTQGSTAETGRYSGQPLFFWTCGSGIPVIRCGMGAARGRNRLRKPSTKWTLAATV
jgi:hypothetical protein